MRRSLGGISALLLMLLALGGCNLSAATPTPLPTPDLPTVEILAPEANTQVYEGTDFDIDIIARDSGTGVANIALYVDDEKINDALPEVSAAVPEFRATMNWLARNPGLHVLRVIAFRLDGTPSREALLTIEVLPR